MNRALLYVMLTVLCASTHAQPPRPGVARYEAGHVRLSVAEPAAGLVAAWQFDRANNGDIRIVKKEQRRDGNVSGSVMMVCDDVAMLLRDMRPAKGKESVEIDNPILYLQLTLRLLERMAPQGPQALKPESDVDFREANAPIRTSRGTSAAREFLAPWRVAGKVTVVEPGKIAFELKFGYYVGAAKAAQPTIALVGLWQGQSQYLAFDSQVPIGDWQVYRIDAMTRNMGGTAVVERSITPFEGRVQKLGDLRALIEREWDAQAPARKREECRL